MEQHGSQDALWLAADRRLSRRRNARIAARARTPEGLSWPCQIVAFSATGILIRYPASRAAAIQHWLRIGGEQVDLYVNPGQSEDWHCLPGHALRAGRETLAIQFPAASLQAFETLLQQAGLVEPDTPIEGAPAADVILSQVRTRWLQEMNKLLLDWTKGLPSSLASVVHGLAESIAVALRNNYDGVTDTTESTQDGADWLILGVLAQRARHRHEAGVGLLHSRLADLGLESACVEPGPLGPEALCRVLGQSVRSRGCSRQESRDLYRRFEVGVLQQLGSVYAGLHSVLARNSAVANAAGDPGMLLHMSASPRRMPGNRRREAEIAVRQLATSPLPSLIEPEELRRGPFDGHRRIEAVRVLHAKLNKQICADSGFPAALVPTLVESLCHSPRLTARGRQLIQSIEPMIARILTRDPGALDASEHPLRRLLNRIGHLDTADHHLDAPWSPELYHPLMAMNSDGSENRAIAEASTAFRRELEAREATYQRQVRTAIKAVEGSERLSEAARVTDEALDDRLLGEPVPRPVLRFVEEEWRNLMVLRFLRNESQDGPWSEALELLDAILDASEVNAATAPQELIARISRALREELEEQPRGDALAQLVEHLHNPHRSRHVKLSAGFRMQPGRTPENGAKPVPGHWEKSLETMPVGTWFLEKREEGATRPIRLAWASDHRRRFLLVGPMGRRVADLTLEDMARRLSQGALLPISRHDQALVDEGLDRLLETLYRRLVERVITDPGTGLCDAGEFRRRVSGMLVAVPPTREHSLIVIGWQGGSAEAAILVRLLHEQLPPGALMGRLDGNRIALLFQGQAVDNWLVPMLRRIHRVLGSGVGNVRAGVAVGDPAIVTAERWLALACRACDSAPFEWPPAFRYSSVPADRMRHLVRLADRLASTEPLRRNELLLRALRIIPLHGAARMPAQHELGMTLPDEHGELMEASELIPLAERYGGGQRLDDWLMQSVLECLRDPMKTFPEAESGVCIPVLGRTLTEPGLIGFMQSLCRDTQYPVGKLWFCVSEAGVMAHPNALALLMREVRAMGGRLCLDMRETDPSMVHLMRRLPVDLIRVRDGEEPREARDGRDALLAAGVAVAHQMGAEVVVSRVSNVQRIDRLRALGVDYAQGPAVARPRLLHH